MASERPSNRRLIVALILASIILGAILTIPVELPSCIDDICEIDEESITSVTIVESNDQELTNSEIVPGKPLERSITQEEQLSHSTASQSESSENQSTDTKPTDEVAQTTVLSATESTTTPRDWTEIARNAAASAVDDSIERETNRAQMWSQSRSVLFKPDDEVTPGEADLQLPDLRFRRRVIGLGATIGGCFVGIPLFGIPVEERTVGVTLIFCGQ